MSTDNLPALTGVAYVPDLVAEDELTDEAARLVGEGLAENTRLAYEHDWKAYLRWAAETGRTPIPASSATLTNYVAHLASTLTGKGEPHAPSSIDRALACILHVHDRAELPKPRMKEARLALRAYRKEQAQAGRRRKKSPAITVERLRLMVAAIPSDSSGDIRARAVLILGVAMMGRREELANLNIEDITFTPRGVEIYLAMSKTDQDAQGTTVRILHGTRPETCTVLALQAWIARMAEQGITSGPLLRPVDQHGNIGGTGSYGGRGNGLRITGHGINYVVKRAARLAGLPNADLYSAHGMRRGGATSAAQSGKGLLRISRHGRWAPNSPIVAGYIEDEGEWEDNAMGDSGL